MPVYNEETFNYEILLRFGDVAPNKGKLTGASRTTITQTTKDGVPIATNINSPEQLALIAGEEGEMLSQVLGEVNAATIIENQNLSNALASEQASTATLTEQLVAAQTEIQRLNDLLAADAATAEKQSDTQQAEIRRLTGLLNAPALAAETPETVESPTA
jgi:hypothetical protein